MPKFREAHNGPVTLNEPYECTCDSSAFLQVSSSGAFTAKLFHLIAPITARNALVDFQELAPAVGFDEVNNYRQTLGGGFYALVFSAAASDVVIGVTEGVDE